MSGLRKRLGAGALCGLGFALLSIVMASVAYLLSSEAAWARRGFTLAQMIVVLATAFPLGGILAGALFPLTKRSIGAFLVGTVALFPSTLALSFMRAPRTHWLLLGLIGGLVVAAFVGGGAALVIWHSERRG
jgi:MFS family permease